jgi:hypothetical protein
MAKQPLTAVIRDTGNIGFEQVLIYQIKADPSDYDDVHEAVFQERRNDLGLSVRKEQIKPMFVLDGYLMPLADWRYA